MRKYFLLSIIILTGLFWSYSFAATYKQTINIAGSSYTLDVCNKRSLLALKMILVNKSQKSDATQQNEIQDSLKEYMKKWTITCNIQKTSPKQAIKKTITPASNDVKIPTVILKNVEILDALSPEDKQKISSVTNSYKTSIKELLPQFYKKGIITKEAYNLYISKELSIVYVNNCKSTTQWSTFIDMPPDSYKVTDPDRQYYYGTNFWINVCSPTTLTSDTNTVVTHEFWHFIYFIIDKNRSTFNNICWWIDKKMNNNCSVAGSNAFFSNYSMGSIEEDYAESFAHWYLQLNWNPGTIQKMKLDYFTHTFDK